MSLPDGSWGNWGEWSECSQSCGQGQRERTRSCNDPAPTGNGTYCSHDGSSCNEYEECNSGNCTLANHSANPASSGVVYVDQQPLGIFDEETFKRLSEEADRVARQVWGDWNDWSECSISCGGGVQERERACKAGDLTLCVGPSKDVAQCNLDSCQIIT